MTEYRRRFPFLNIYSPQGEGESCYIVGNAEGCDELRTLLIKAQQFNRPQAARAEIVCTESSMFDSAHKLVKVCLIRVDDHLVQSKLSMPYAWNLDRNNVEAIFPWEIMRLIKGDDET